MLDRLKATRRTLFVLTMAGGAMFVSACDSATAPDVSVADALRDSGQEVQEVDRIISEELHRDEAEGLRRPQNKYGAEE